jgi:hypothetical protein
MAAPVGKENRMWEYKASKPWVHGQTVQFPVRSADEIIEYYFKCRYWMTKNGSAIPFQALRDYLDVCTEMRHEEVGNWYSRRLVIGKRAQIGLWDFGIFNVAIDEGWEIEVR